MIAAWRVRGCGDLRGNTRKGELTTHEAQPPESHELSPRVESQLRVARIIECVGRVREWPVQQVEVKPLHPQPHE